MTRYEQGSRLEYDVAFMLRDREYYVIRSAGSHGIVDLVAIWEGTLLFIQCKKKEKQFREKQLLIDLCEKHKIVVNDITRELSHKWPMPIFAYKKLFDSVVTILLENLISGDKLFAWPIRTVRMMQAMKAEEKKELIAKSDR
jgi:hypothetical protein